MTSTAKSFKSRKSIDGEKVNSLAFELQQKLGALNITTPENELESQRCLFDKEEFYALQSELIAREAELENMKTRKNRTFGKTKGETEFGLQLRKTTASKKPKMGQTVEEGEVSVSAGGEGEEQAIPLSALDRPIKLYNPLDAKKVKFSEQKVLEKMRQYGLHPDQNRSKLLTADKFEYDDYESVYSDQSVRSRYLLFCFLNVPVVQGRLASKKRIQQRHKCLLERLQSNLLAFSRRSLN